MEELTVRRNLLTVAFSTAVGLTAFYRLPFPEENGLLQLVLLQKPYLFHAIKYAYVAMLFSTPYIAFLIARIRSVL